MPPRGGDSGALSACRRDTPMGKNFLRHNSCGRPKDHVEISLRPGNGSGIDWRSRLLSSQLVWLEPPGDACGESQRTIVRSSAFTVGDQP